MMGRAAIFKSLAIVLLWHLCAEYVAAATVTDDMGNVVSLARPAQRIVSLAPHTTEMLFSIGAGELVVGAVQFSDYPDEARHIPRVGNALNIDLERILAMRPDLVVAWQSGNSEDAVTTLRTLGVPIYLSEPRRLNQIGGNILDLGVLTGKEDNAHRLATQFAERLAVLQATYGTRHPVRVFYQIWQQPLMTINGQHLISQVLTLCGGINIFADLPVLAPRVDLESVLARKVEAILISSSAVDDTQAIQSWSKWQSLAAVRERHIYNIPWDLISRHSLRIVEGAGLICEALDQAREQAGYSKSAPPGMVPGQRGK